MSHANQKASLKISQEVMEKIAGVAAREVDGIANIVEPQGNIRGFFSSSIGKKPVIVKITDGTAEIDIALELDFGVNIEDTAKKVQKAVKDNVQTMTGVVVTKVNISVENIRASKRNVKAESAESGK